MDQKIAFINEWKAGKHTFKSLCEQFGISRALGYRLCRRYEAEKEKGLEPRSRAPHTVHNKTLTQVEMALCDLRLKFKRFGADKLLTLLREDYGMKDLPAVSTAHLILKRNGLIQPKKRYRRIEPVKPIFDPKACCHPLTIADSYSRFVFRAKGLLHPTLEGCQAGFTEVFREWGLPQQLHTDNGPPFGSAISLCRLTRLAVWLLELGIDPVYSDPGHPEQNGRHAPGPQRGGDPAPGL
jgi:transposase InsO family protein